MATPPSIRCIKYLCTGISDPRGTARGAAVENDNASLPDRPIASVDVNHYIPNNSA